MKRSDLWVAATLGMVSSLSLMAVSYLGSALAGLPFIPFDLFDWLARHLPGGIIDANIRLLIRAVNTLHLGPTAATAKHIEQVQALGVIAAVGLGFGLVLGLVRQHRPVWLTSAGLFGGLLLWLGLVGVEWSLAVPGFLEGALWQLVLLAGWGWLLARALGAWPDTILDDPGHSGQPVTRRTWLATTGAGLLSLVVLALGLRRDNQLAGAVPKVPVPQPPLYLKTTVPRAESTAALDPNTVAPFEAGPAVTSGLAASPSPALLARRIDPVPDTRAEITETADFYRVDYNAVPATIDADAWRLTLNGMVKNPLNLTLGEILQFPRVTQAVTMECIDNLVGGDLISTNYWTGARLMDVLEKGVLLPGVKEIAMTARDGYFENIPLAEAMDQRTLLVYAMNGEALTPEHGFPLRLYTPGHYGMKMPKWLTTLEAINHHAPGYWVERNWSETAIIETTSAIDNITVDGIKIGPDGTVPLGGIAWAGKRGISQVEVQIDDGPWVLAVLRIPAVSPLTWVQWRYDWSATLGAHQVQVRATDGAGVPQKTRGADPQPEGATGIYSKRIVTI